MMKKTNHDRLVPANNGQRQEGANEKTTRRSGTFSQLYVQIVFAVQNRQYLIPAEHRVELHKFIIGIVQKRNHKLISVFCMPDHIHILIGYRPSSLIPDLVRDIKTGTSNFINNHNWVSGKFAWQEGYAAFSYSRSQLDRVVKYILNQEKHHENKSFKKEYLEFLDKFEVEYDEKYLFQWI